MADAEKAHADRYIFLGDYYMCLPYPNQAIDTIKNHPNSIIVRGNEEDRTYANRIIDFVRHYSK